MMPRGKYQRTSPSAPPGYLTTGEYAALNELTKSQVSNLMHVGRVPYIKIGRMRFIREKAQVKVKR